MTARMPQRYLHWMGFLTALALLSSCSILPAETFEVYQLPPSSIAIATAPDRLPLTLHIAKAGSPRVSASVETAAGRDQSFASRGCGH